MSLTELTRLIHPPSWFLWLRLPTAPIGAGQYHFMEEGGVNQRVQSETELGEKSYNYIGRQGVRYSILLSIRIL